MATNTIFQSTSRGVDTVPTANSENLITSGGVKSALSKKIDVSETYTTATTLADTGVSVTIPSNSVYCINARTGYVNTAPNVIALVLGSGAANSAIAYSERNADMNNVSCTFCGFTGSTTATVHVFAKCAVADRTNIATISGFYAAY